MTGRTKKDEIPEPHTVYPTDDRPVPRGGISSPDLRVSSPPVFLCLFVIFDSRSFPHYHPLPWFLLRTLYTLLLSHTVHQENASPLGARIVVPPNLYLVFRCPRHLTRALEDQVGPLPAV